MRAKGLRVVPTITASGLTPSRAIWCLGSATSRSAHVAKVLAVMGSRSYDGVDIDYEHLALTTSTTTATQVRTAYTAFVTELCAKVRDRGKACHVTVMPRTSDDLAIWRGRLIPGVYDYAAIATAATHLRVMAYDQHAGAYGPGPVAGTPWVIQVMTYAESKAPRSRLELGVPTYGRDFAAGSSTSLSSPAATALAGRHGATIHDDLTQGESTFTYSRSGSRHTVWFSGKRAVAAKATLAHDRGWAGACYWAAGHEQSGTWSAVRRAVETPEQWGSVTATGSAVRPR